MRNFLIAAAAMLVGACGHGGSEPPAAASAAGKPLAIVNGDFEQPGNGGAIPGWQYLHHAGVDAYKVSLDTESPAQGKVSAKMTRSQPQIYGTLSQLVSVKGYDGKTVRVTAKMKTDGVGEKGWVLFMSARGLPAQCVQCADDGYDGVERRQYRGEDAGWGDAAQSRGELLDAGTGWFDDVRVSVVD